MRIGDGNDLRFFTTQVIVTSNKRELETFLSLTILMIKMLLNTDDGSGSTTTYFRADGSTGVELYHYGNQETCHQINWY